MFPKITSVILFRGPKFLKLEIYDKFIFDFWIIVMIIKKKKKRKKLSSKVTEQQRN